MLQESERGINMSMSKFAKIVYENSNMSQRKAIRFANELTRICKRHQRFCIKKCNQPVSNIEHVYDSKDQDCIINAINKYIHNVVKVETDGDPRGHCTKIYFKDDMYRNELGGAWGLGL